MMVSWFVATPICLAVAHALRRRVHWAISNSAYAPTYIIVGANSLGFELFRRLPRRGFLGFFDFRGPDRVAEVIDPAIAKPNPGVKLPSQRISVFYRSDESGTTQNFEAYLAGAAPSDYTAKPSKKWSGTVGHGAGTNMRHATLQSIADRLAEVGIAALRYNFPYSENGKGFVVVHSTTRDESVSRIVAQLCPGAPVTTKY